MCGSQRHEIRKFYSSDNKARAEVLSNLALRRQHAELAGRLEIATCQGWKAGSRAMGEGVSSSQAMRSALQGSGAAWLAAACGTKLFCSTPVYQCTTFGCAKARAMGVPSAGIFTGVPAAPQLSCILQSTDGLHASNGI